MPARRRSRPAPKPRVRAPDQTRERLLAAAFREMYRHGFQAASLDAILAGAGVTKGALYHHFPDKAALGLAVATEVIRGLTLDRWLEQLAAPGDPIAQLTAVLREHAGNIQPHVVELGCPLNNLAQEMSPVDERFRTAIDAIYADWRGATAAAIARGQADGSVRTDVDPMAVAGFVVASVEGSFGLAKGMRDGTILRENLLMLARFLEGLRPRSPLPASA